MAEMTLLFGSGEHLSSIVNTVVRTVSLTDARLHLDAGRKVSK